MAKEPDNLILVLLREIRVKQDEQSVKLDAMDVRLAGLEKSTEDLHITVTYSLGQSTETQMKQAKQGARIDDLFGQLEKLLEKEKS
jgi:predicted ribosome quality control (RQC) complex YloA/Tae2 family protein